MVRDDIFFSILFLYALFGFFKLFDMDIGCHYDGNKTDSYSHDRLLDKSSSLSVNAVPLPAPLALRIGNERMKDA